MTRPQNLPRHLRNSDIADLLEKAVAGDRLSYEDGVRLFESNDLAGMGWAANRLREERHGNVAYYLKNRHINYSNVCKYDCFFCSFYRKSKDDEGAWEWTVDQVLEHVESFKDSGLQEFHIVGGVHPDLPFSYYTDMLGSLRAAHPGVALKAFTAIEIAYFSELTGKSIRDVLAELQEAGLNMLPGGGAE
ncbi:MAG: radical SAM protein, partial [Planctomycetota bacterium]